MYKPGHASHFSTSTNNIQGMIEVGIVWKAGCITIIIIIIPVIKPAPLIVRKEDELPDFPRKTTNGLATEL